MNTSGTGIPRCSAADGARLPAVRAPMQWTHAERDEASMNRSIFDQLRGRAVDEGDHVWVPVPARRRRLDASRTASPANHSCIVRDTRTGARGLRAKRGAVITTGCAALRDQLTPRRWPPDGPWLDGRTTQQQREERNCDDTTRIGVRNRTRSVVSVDEHRAAMERVPSERSERRTCLIGTAERRSEVDRLLRAMLQHQGVVIGQAQVIDLRVELLTRLEQQLSRRNEHRRAR